MLGLGWIMGAVWLGRRSAEKGEEAKIKEIKVLYGTLSHSKTYSEWLSIAEKLDELEGADAFKNDPSSPYYDSELIQ